MLASRGWVYASKQAAGVTHQFHRDCDCQIVPEWKRGKITFDGYDPDQLYDMYARARGQEPGATPSVVAQRMRRLFPMALTDGVVERPEGVRPITVRTLNHILEGESDGRGGHSYRRRAVHKKWMADPERFGLDGQALARLRSKKYFPADWTDDMIVNSIMLVLQRQPSGSLDGVLLGKRGKFRVTISGSTVEVVLTRTKSGLKVITAYPPWEGVSL